jgi:hypothetical protein
VKVSKDLGLVSVKSMQTSLQACITWPKKSSMLIKLNLGIVVVDLGIAMDFDINIFIFVVYCK